MSDTLMNRYEFVYLFDVENGNPNGDPDAGNMPRVDPQTNNGLVTDVCLKRKIRNYVETAKGGGPPFEIYVKERGVLNHEHERAYLNNPEIERPPAKKLPKKAEEAKKITRWMCDNFYDVRTFGAVMTTEVNCGQVRGPVQINFARSIDPIIPLEISITRMAVTNERDLEKERTMGRKHIVPYALYRAEGYVSAKLAETTGFSEGDLKLLWEALENMFDHDHSAARGKMNARALYIFRHDSPLGNASAHVLLSLVEINRVGDQDQPARCFADYSIAVRKDRLPMGVSLIEAL
jgi:CRISPR-associated protein Csd2